MGRKYTKDRLKELTNQLLARGVKIISPVEKARDKVTCVCLNCDNIWRSDFNNLIHRHCGCPVCAVRSVTNNSIKTRVEDIRHLNIKMLNIYVNGETSNKFKCLELNCGHEWISTLKLVAQGSGCSKCKLKSLMKSV